MTSIAIVCGYHDLDSLPEYITLIAPHLHTDAPSFAILSGGITSGAERSEAAVMAETLSEICPEQPFLLDEEAMTTLDNLVNGKALAERTFGRVSQWTVFCDTTHRIKVTTLARLILGRSVAVRHVPRPANLGTRLLEPPTLAIEACAAIVPPLRPFVRNVARWWRTTSRRR